jgi:hypothetical protein
VKQYGLDGVALDDGRRCGFELHGFGCSSARVWLAAQLLRLSAWLLCGRGGIVVVPESLPAEPTLFAEAK